MNDEDRFEYEVMSQMEQSTELGELFAALSKAQGQMTGAVKDSNNPFFKSKYADLHQVWEAVRKPLSDNNLAVMQTTNVRKDRLFVVTTMGHSSGQWMKSYTPVKMMKDDPQAMGSAITYARRYALAAICGIAQMDDDAESEMSRGQISGQVIDPAKIQKAVDFFKQAIDEDDLEGGHEKIKAAWNRLTNDERLKVQERLGDKAPDSNRMYKTILKDYLNHTEAAA